MSQEKQLRKQLRNVAQEVVKDMITTELIIALEDRLNKTVEARLSAVDAHVKKMLEQQDTRAKAIQGFLTRQVAVNLDNRVHNMDVTLRAWQEVMNDKIKAALGSDEDFNAAVDAKKIEIQNRLQQQAVDKQQEAISQPAEAPKAE